MDAATEKTASASAIVAPADFSDRLSPMLVKELRQGLRTRAFTSVFILLQVLLMFSTFVASSTTHGNEVLQGLYLFVLFVTLFLIQPLRGVNAVHQEAKLNTLELILLTRLDAFRIVSGKWASIVSQSALFTIAVLPYVVLRYFLGGVDLIQDLVFLITSLFFSAGLTALTVGFSAFQAVLLRAMLFVGAGFAALTLTNVAGFMMFSSGSFFGLGLSGQALTFTIVAMVLTGAFFIYYLLDMGAARIAPPSDNHATRKRLLALAAVLVLFLLPLLGVDEEFSLFVAFSIMIVACIDALTETPAVTPGVFQGFFYRRLLPSFAKNFLAPGWHTGILFCLAVLAMFAAFLAGYSSSPVDPEDYGFPIILSSIILFPVLITQLFFKDSTQLMNLYVVVQCICTTVATILGTTSQTADVEWILWMACFIPHVSFFIAMNSSSAIPAVTVLCGTIFVITVAVGIGRAVPLFREMKRSYRIARNSTTTPDPDSASAPPNGPLKDQP